MIKCVGYHWSTGSGEIEGTFREWDNLVLHMLSEDNPDVVGFECSTYKIKRKDVSRFLNGLSPDDYLDKAVSIESGLVRGKLAITHIRILK